MSGKRAITTLFTPLNYEIYIAMFNHDLGKFNIEIFLIQLDKIMTRSDQDVPGNCVLSRFGKIIHVLSRLSRSCMSM